MVRPRVLLLAEACNPEWTSVPLVGWSHYQAIARRCDAHLVTQIRNTAALERAGLVSGRDFTPIDSEFVIRPAMKAARLIGGGRNKGWTALTASASLAYPFFERLVWKRFGPRIRARDFDIVHRLTPLSPTAPSPLAAKCAGAGVPFVVGPLNGGLPWPWQFDAARRKEKEWLSYVRGAYRLLPGYRSTRRHAAAILIASMATWDQMPPRYRDKCFYIPENAIEPARFPHRRMRRASRPLQAVFIGRLVPYKGADMLLEAATPLVREGVLRVTILGDGPQMPELKDIVERNGIGDGVDLAGFVPHAQLQSRLLEMDVLAFPSIREFGGAVVLEAMASGLVPIVVNYGGPGELVTDATGFRVPLTDRAGIISAFRDILARLCANPEPLDPMSHRATRRAMEQFTWDSKAARVLSIYQWLMAPTGPRPVCPMPLPDPDGDGDASDTTIERADASVT